MLVSRIVAAIAALAGTALADAENGVELRQLGEGNFKASIGKGLW